MTDNAVASTDDLHLPCIRQQKDIMRPCNFFNGIIELDLTQTVCSLSEKFMNLTIPSAKRFLFVDLKILVLAFSDVMCTFLTRILQ